MKEFPSIPTIDAAADQLLSGHLWLIETIDGAPLRFRLQESGLVQFGDHHRVYDTPDAVPEPYQHAVSHIQTALDRTALQRAVDDVEAVVFFGVATQKGRIDYDWARLPSFLGVDVWSADAGQFRPPDAAESIFDRLGLQPVNVFERERHARDFDPDSYTVPQSAWYDGPAAGVLVRNKRGDRGQLLSPELRGSSSDDPVPIDAAPEELAARYATRTRFERLASTLDGRGQPVTFETLYDHVLESITREAHTQLYDSGWDGDLGAFRSEIAALTRQFLADR